MAYHRWQVLTLVMAFCFFTFFANDAFAAKTEKKSATESSVSTKSSTKSKSSTKVKNESKADTATPYPGTASISSKSKAKKSSKTSSTDKKKKSSRNKSSLHSERSGKRSIDSRRVWLEDSGDQQSGKASWYGDSFHGGPTASGLSYDMHAFTAAHRTLPIGTVVKVTVENTNRSVMVCINDRGPFVKGRVIDLSYAAARQLGFGNRGIMPVQIEVISDPQGRPLDNDSAFYVTKFESSADKKGETLGPFRQFADATVMHEVLSGEQTNSAVIELGPLASNQK